MKRKLIGIVVVLSAVFAITACNVSLKQYKNDAKAEIDAYAATKVEADYNIDNWAKILGFAATGKAAINDAKNKESVDSAVTITKKNINIVPKDMPFPSVLESLEIADFTDDFFQNNTLFLVPLNHGYLLYDYVEFYTVYVNNGKLNFVIEITDPIGGGNEAIDGRIFVVCISNSIANEFEIGERIKFNTYDFSAGSINNPPFELPPLNNRDWLLEIQANSVKHRVGLFMRDNFKLIGNNIIKVSSRQTLNDLLA